MVKLLQNQFVPNYLSPPGETLEDTLEAVGMSQSELAERTGLARKTVNLIVKGKASLTQDTALKLERVLGVPASFWSAREQQYQEMVVRLEEQRRLKKYSQWLKQFPIGAMSKFGWVKSSQDKVKQIRELLNFFGVASPDEWQGIWINNPKVTFRRSKIFQGDPGAVSAWVRMGEARASRMKCEPYSAEKFKEVLQSIRALTVSLPDDFADQVKKLCAECGIAVVYVRELPGVPVSGVTQWLNSDKAMIQLSLRFRRDDHFWFSFYHEAGHILLHPKKDTFLEDNGNEKDAKEMQADQFASDILIPRGKYAEFLSQGSLTKTRIKDFAKTVGIAPGVVVGRLQHEGKLPYSRFNDLKVRLAWD